MSDVRIIIAFVYVDMYTLPVIVLQLVTCYN